MCSKSLPFPYIACESRSSRKLVLAPTSPQIPFLQRRYLAPPLTAVETFWILPRYRSAASILETQVATMGDSFAADPTRVMHVAVLSVFCFFALVAVIFRLWARRVQRARWEVNDYLCIVALVIPARRWSLHRSGWTDCND